MVTRSLDTPPAGRGFRQTIARVLPGLKATPLETQARRKQCQGPWTWRQPSLEYQGIGWYFANSHFKGI